MLKIYPENLAESLETKQDKDSLVVLSTQNIPPEDFQRKESKSSYLRSQTTKSFRNFLIKRLESRSFAIFMLIITIYALFGDDIRLSFFSKPEDNIFFGLAAFCMFVFLTELFFSMVFKRNYSCSYYFWLDLISTISMIPDIGWLWDLIIGIGLNSSGSNTQKFQNTAKASRIGARTTRIIRIIRLVRLVRIIKLYKHVKVLKNDEGTEDLEEELLENTEKESLLGNTLTELITKKAITMTLIVLLILPLLDPDFYNTDVTWDIDLASLLDFSKTNSFQFVQNLFIHKETSTQYPLIHYTYNNYSWDSDVDYNGLRGEEIYFVEIDPAIAIFDLTKSSQLQSLLNIFQTIFVMIILTASALIFARDSEILIIRPIRNMIEKVKRISNDPSILFTKNKIKKDLKPSTKKCCENGNEQVLEIEVIEGTILKIGVLLLLVFGEAGGNIIRDSMNIDGDIVLGLQGTKIFAVFCLCDIRNFTDVTEELQEGIILFVNEIAHIIHQYSYIYLGAANKNIGDAFLLVWKIKEENINDHAINTQLNADLSLLCVLKILCNIKKEPILQKYRDSSRLNARLKGFDIKIGFGLHMGWAIEGAVGSEFKIDPSYLSPHVNIAMKLESLTKIYGIPIIFSDTIENYISQPLRNHCRLIDNVNINDSRLPIKIFTIDVNTSRLIIGNVKNKSRNFINSKQKKIKSILKSRETLAFLVFERSKSVKSVTNDFEKDFYDLVNKATEFYIDGFWLSAKEAFEAVLKIRPNDQPSIALLFYMKERNFSAPHDWEGFRDFTT